MIYSRKTPKRTSCLFFILVPCLIHAQAPVTFERYYDTLGANYGNHVIQTSDGGYLVTGGANSSPSNMDVMLLKVDTIGNVQWTKKYGGLNTDAGVATAELPNGDFIVLAVKNLISTSDSEIWLLKTTSLGDTIWTKTISAGPGWNYPYSLELTNDTGCIIGGSTSAIGNGSYDAFLVKCNSVGNVIWMKAYGGPGADEAVSVVQTSDGHYIVGGMKEDTSALNGFDVYFLYTDSVGDTLWTKTFGGAYYDRCMSVVEANNGDLILAGYSFDAMENRYKYFISSHSTVGVQSWFKKYGYGVESSCISITKNVDGNYFLFGSVYETFNPNYDFCMIKTDVNGDSLWSIVLGTQSADQGYSFGLTNDNGFVMVGKTYSYPALGSNIYLIKTDSVGFVPLANLQFNRDYSSNVSIYPNPASEYFQVICREELINESFVNIEVFNIIGQTTFQQVITVKNTGINTENWPNGMYFARVSTDSKIISEIKIIIQH